METPPFEPVLGRGATRPARPKARDWRPLIAAITGKNRGRQVFLPHDQIDDGNVKYLSLAIQRRGKDERLRTRRGTYKGVQGRFLWAEKERVVKAIPVEGIVVNEDDPKPQVAARISPLRPDAWDEPPLDE